MKLPGYRKLTLYFFMHANKMTTQSLKKRRKNRSKNLKDRLHFADYYRAVFPYLSLTQQSPITRDKLNYRLRAWPSRAGCPGLPMLCKQPWTLHSSLQPQGSFVQQGSGQAHFAIPLTSRKKLLSITSERLLTSSVLGIWNNLVCCL